MRNNRTRRVRMTESDLRRLVRRVINETNHSEMDKMEMADMDMNEMGVYGFKHHKGHSDQGYLDREGEMLGGKHGHEDDEMSMKTRERMSRGTRKFDMGETVSMDDMDEMYMRRGMDEQAMLIPALSAALRSTKNMIKVAQMMGNMIGIPKQKIDDTIDRIESGDIPEKVKTQLESAINAFFGGGKPVAEGMGHDMDEMSDEDMVEMMKRSEMKEKYHARKAMKERMKKEKMEESFRRSLRRR